MQALQTAVLEHADGHGIHHDWLIEDPTLADPGAPDARLWTARVAPPPDRWAALGRFDLTPIPPHRRRYLTYQGAVSGGRGFVRRVAEGVALPRLWSAGRIELDLRLGLITGPITLRQAGPDRWVAVWA